ncbi:multiple cyclophane-containing RiPP AmcA [Plantactinospora sp. GCM10030261]|uniref:multiple cyclophane-containing RiPP AmcA n=1 Tax=Plantactinospora sp. GCM10030261 TaxID=3273420 RepID=UPI00361CC036
MPEKSNRRRHDDTAGGVTDRVRGARAGLNALLREAEAARRRRAEVVDAVEGAGAVCAWNHFENIPTFYNWNNRPR